MLHYFLLHPASKACWDPEQHLCWKTHLDENKRSQEMIWGISSLLLFIIYLCTSFLHQFWSIYLPFFLSVIRILLRWITSCIFAASALVSCCGSNIPLDQVAPAKPRNKSHFYPDIPVHYIFSIDHCSKSICVTLP